MQIEQHGGTTRPRISRYVAAALIIYGAVGIVVHLRLLSLLYSGLVGWFGLGAAPFPLAFMEPLQAYYDAMPWLPWAAWLFGVGLLTFRRTHTTTPVLSEANNSTGYAPIESIDTSSQRKPRWLALVLLIALLLLAGFARMVLLLPQDIGLSEKPYDDEGVYAGASQLFIQGVMPYRDYFFAHPPVAALSYAPAMMYHFTEWGSPTSFMMARYLSVGYSLVTLAILFLIGLRLAGVRGGTTAGLLWALDGRVIEINRKVMLDGPMVLLSCAALLLYLWARPFLSGDESVSVPRRPLLVLLLAGVCAALSALTKIAGVACLLALLADMAWLWVVRHDAGPAATRASRAGLVSLLLGVGGALVVVLGPFLVLAPSQIVRDVFFFQLLRPGDGIVNIPARIAELTADLRDPITLLFAALGFVAISLWIWMRRLAGEWWVVAVWMFFSVLLFTYSRSFYQHYYIQLAAPLCLMGAGVSLIPQLVRRVMPASTVSRIQVLGGVGAALLALVVLPLLGAQWSGIVRRTPDRIFELVGKYMNNAVPPGSPVLSTDEQFNFLAARPPSHNATGYLVDSYGHMISLGLGLNTRDWGDLWSSVLRGEHGIPTSAPTQGADPEALKHRGDVYGAMLRPEPQADFLDRASHVPLIVLHTTGFNRLTTATQKTIAAESLLVEQKERYSIYRVEKAK